jgi:hypothetical protein
MSFSLATKIRLGVRDFGEKCPGRGDSASQENVEIALAKFLPPSDRSVACVSQFGLRAAVDLVVGPLERGDQRNWDVDGFKDSVVKLVAECRGEREGTNRVFGLVCCSILRTLYPEIADSKRQG